MTSTSTARVSLAVVRRVRTLRTGGPAQLRTGGAWDDSLGGAAAMPDSTRACAVAECDRQATKRGWCQKHYDRWRAHGSTDKRVRHRASDPERFLEKVDTSGECWVWTGAYRHSYGEVWVNGRKKYAHRVAFELFNGPIPDGHVICHRCDNPACVRPEHLFAGTQTDNMRDALAKGRLDLSGLELGNGRERWRRAA